MVGVMDPASRAAHDAYHRLVRAGAWSLARCFEALCKLVVASLVGPVRIVLYLDDTLFHRNGPKARPAGEMRCARREGVSCTRGASTSWCSAYGSWLRGEA